MERSIETKGMGGSPEVTEDEDIREALVGDDLVLAVDRDDARPDADVVLDDDVALRSDLATHLRPSAFPADKFTMGAVAREEGAPEEVLVLIERLPEGVWFETVNDAWTALGGPVEHRGVPEDQGPDDALGDTGMVERRRQAEARPSRAKSTARRSATTASEGASVPSPDEAAQMAEALVRIDSGDLQPYDAEPATTSAKRAGERAMRAATSAASEAATAATASGAAATDRFTGATEKLASPASVVERLQHAIASASEAAVHVPLEVAHAAGGFVTSTLRRLTRRG